LATPSNKTLLKGHWGHSDAPAHGSRPELAATRPPPHVETRERGNALLSDAQHLNRHDRDCLIPKNAFIGFDLAGDVRVLNHFR
jgi:hypothetical protein